MGTAADSIIYIAASTDDALQECLTISRNSSHKLQEVLEDHERRFVAWWQYLGVFASPRANLDARLHHNPEIKDMVVSLLILLTRNFQLLSQCIQEGSSTPQSNPTLSKTNLAVSSIDQTLTQLSHVGYSICNSSRPTETTRARRFVAIHHDLSLFESAALQAIITLYPSASDALQSQLSRSMVDRYARILYRTRRQESLSFDGGLGVSGPTTTVLEAQSAIGFRVSSRDTDNIQIAVPRAPPTLGLTSVHPSGFRERSRSPVAPRSYFGATTALLQNCREPAIPPLGSEDDRICRWCSKTLKLHDVKNEKWTLRGREHYRCDLEPYICLSEKCTETIPSFSSVRKWQQHMRSHGPTWTHDEHNSFMWLCPVCHKSKENTTMNTAHETEVRLPTAHHLHSHLKLLHPAFVSTMTDAELRELVNSRDFMTSRQRNECMLCHSRIERILKGSVSKIKPFRSAGSSCATDPQQKGSTIHQGSHIPSNSSGVTAHDPDLDSMERHILQHLHFIMLVSLQLIDNKMGEFQNTPEDDSGKHGVSVNNSISSRQIENASLSSFESQRSPISASTNKEPLGSERFDLDRSNIPPESKSFTNLKGKQI